MDYITDTKNAYKNPRKAKEYHELYAKGIKWSRFTMWRQKRLLKRILKKSNLKEEHKILDIPCGTGFIGDILCKTTAEITASDISPEMIKIAQSKYYGDNFKGFVVADITETKFESDYFDCVIILAIMHRLPKEIRDKSWKEIIRITKNYVIVSYSVDSSLQRFKKYLLKVLFKKYVPAPNQLPLNKIVKEIKSYGLNIIKIYSVAHILSGKVIFFIKK